jgi:hypothetical protein
MDQTPEQLPFCFDFIACKLLNLHVLIRITQSGRFERTVMLTHKRRHFGTNEPAPQSLTLAGGEAYKQRGKTW